MIQFAELPDLSDDILGSGALLLQRLTHRRYRCFAHHRLYGFAGLRYLAGIRHYAADNKRLDGSFDQVNVSGIEDKSCLQP